MKTHGRNSLTALVLLLQLLIFPSSPQVAVFPVQAVASLGGIAVIQCISFSSKLTKVEWLINGTSLNDGQFSDIVTSNQRSTLQFNSVPAEYNNTRIQCRGNSVLSSRTSTLLVQGSLAAVGSLLVDGREDHIYVNWTAPFSLDITFSPVNITYCVDVVSSISSATLHSECGINVTEFTYFLPPRSWCYEYNFTVTPVNMAGNGTKTYDTYQVSAGLELVEVIVLTTNTTTSLSFVMTSPVCFSSVTFNNIYNDEIIAVNDTQLTSSGTIVVLSLDLTSNTLYEVVLFASNINDIVRSEKIISTYDIADCSANPLGENIAILVSFMERTEATGALLNFIYINEDGTVDFSMSFSRIIEKTRDLQNASLLLNASYPGDYVVHAYDIERDKQIVNGINYPASTCNFSVSEGPEKIASPPPQNGNCTVHSSNPVIYVECQSLSRFQVTAQINDSRKVNILHVNSSSQSIASVEVPEIGEYFLTVLPIQDGKGILSGMTFLYIHTVTEEMATASLTGSSSFTSSSRGSTEMVDSTCATQVDMLTSLLLSSVVLFLLMEHF